MTAPKIITPLPGPNAAQALNEDATYVSPSYTRSYPLVVERAEGAVVEDVDGNHFLDFTAGIAVCSTGHCHPEVVRAIREQAGRLIHMSGTDFYYRQQSSLARELARIAPGPSPKRVFFTNSGAESVEAALKLARYSTGRHRFIAFFGAFHGRTMGALSLTCSKTVQVRRFGPLLSHVHHVPFPNCERCPFDLTGTQGVRAGCCRGYMRYIEELLFGRGVPPEEVAAIVVEPIQGEGGYVIPPPEFHRDLKALCERHGILYVVDEVQTGMGRTGKMFAIEHWGVEPDIMCFGKGIASGLPLGGIIAKSDVMTWEGGAHASTFGGNPVACEAALATIRLLEGGLVANAESTGAYLLRRLEVLQQRFPSLRRARGRGLMAAVDVVRAGESGVEPAPGLRDALLYRCYEKGLLLLGCGQSGIRFCPPLIITPGDVDTMAAIIAEALDEMVPADAMSAVPLVAVEAA
jgi:4-aminobutyrate aminotransferase